LSPSALLASPSTRYGAAVGVLVSAAGVLVSLEGAPARYGAAVVLVALVLSALAARRPLRRRATRLAAVTVMGCAGVAGLDVGLRAAIGDTMFDRQSLVFVHTWPVDPDLTRGEPGVRDEREVRGDLTGMLGDLRAAEPRRVRFATDAHGFRNDRLPARPVDVVLLGDSFALGEGTTQDATWATLLGGRGLEVYDVAYPGSPGAEVLNLAYEAPRLPLRDGTVVVWALFAGNDLWEHYPRRIAPLHRGPLARLETELVSFRTRSPLRLLLFERASARPDLVQAARRPSGEQVLFFTPYVERAREELTTLRAEPRYPLLVESVGLMKRVAAAHHLRVLVVVLPSKAEVYGELAAVPRRTPTAFAGAVTPLARAVGFEVLDLAPALRAEADRRGERGRLLWWRDDTHWNEDGHALAAREVHAALARLGWLPSGAVVSK
jgi:hypothetical protein